MPNWCENKLIITGNSKDIQFFKEKAKNKQSVFNLNNFVPMPKELEKTESPSRETNLEYILKYGCDNWFDWSLKNWGVKWDVSNADLVEESKSYLEYIFDTAWVAPLKAIKEISELYPKLLFKIDYIEPGMEFYGRSIILNGNFIEKYQNSCKISKCGTCEEETITYPKNICYNCRGEK